MKPLLRSMRPAALTAGADGDSRYVHRKGNVGVGRGAIEACSNPEMSIHGANVIQQRRIVGKLASGTRADLADLSRNPAAIRALVLDLERALDAGCQQGRQLIELHTAFRADIEFRTGMRRNRVDAGAAFENAEVERRAGRA